MKKVIYENLDFGGGRREVGYYHTSYDNERIIESIFNSTHMYHGNHVRGHGRFKLEVFNVNREDDNSIKQDIEKIEKDIEYTMKKIENFKKEKDALTKQLISSEPYEETFVETIIGGHFASDEEVVADGYSLEGVDD